MREYVPFPRASHILVFMRDFFCYEILYLISAMYRISLISSRHCLVRALELTARVALASEQSGYLCLQYF